MFYQISLMQKALTDLYLPESFELVHMSNALDHSFIPIVCIMNMLEVVKVGGKVILRHVENEAEHEEYRGFYQWNVTKKDGVLKLFNKIENIDVNDLISRYCDIKCKRISGERERERDSIHVVLTRT